MSLWDALRMNMMISYQELVRTFPYKDPSYNDDFGIETPSALDNFTQAIQSQILGGLLSNINTGKPGRMVTNDYIVDIANRDGQLQLNVTDRKTGQTSTIQVSGLQNNSTDF
ncbi:curli production assembly/transport protein CsgF [Escherichia coli]|nr:curli production assembly/transport protein CsgF [Escherichia coli]TEW58185.1 curli production assembly/transport protein CsgF [Escherichia coli]